ncbi:hypothetical protein INT45_011783 [Circinella minor]|uniref:Uncharacterized protein n=1 Tax=Circinella minor TaxID=1195481 RepID=A0A8H7S9H5_9FUNG|nr:hypothetical protein INT45_011783 [Circinella minor]
MTDIDVQPTLVIQPNRSPWVQMVEIIEDRLSESRVPLNPNTEHFAELLTQQVPVHGEITLTRLLEICVHSAAVADAALVDFLGLVDITTEQLEARQQFHIRHTVYYYIRSLEFTREEFIQILTQYQLSFPADSVFAANFIEELEQSPTQNHVHLRYVGCTSENTPRGRLQDDISGIARNRFSNFYQCLHNIFPNKHFRVYLVPNFSFDSEEQNYGQRHLIDGREQILIHFLGRSVLLNSQPGGFYRAYQPGQDDVDLMRQYGHNDLAYEYLYADPNNNAVIGYAGDQFHQQQRAALHNVYHQGYHGALGVEDPVSRNLIREEHIQFYTDSALPRPCYVLPTGGHTPVTPVTIFAKDITRSDFAELRHFFAGSRSGDVTRTILGYCFPGHITDQFFAPSFHDLWPCRPRSRHRGDLPNTLVTVSGEIIQALNTIIIVTLGFQPTSVAFSNFQGSYSLGESEFKNMIGNPTIVDHNINFTPSIASPIPTSNYSILIPHLHPGFVSYGSASPVILRFMHLTWCKTIILLNTVIGMLIGGATPHNPKSRPFCDEALRLFNERCEQGDINDQFERSRAQVIQMTSVITIERIQGTLLQAEMNGFPSVGPQAYRPSIYARTAMLQRHDLYGLTLGGPGTPERTLQRLELERKQYPELRQLQSFRNRHITNEWREWFCNLAEGRHILGLIAQRIGVERTTPIPGMSLSKARIINNFIHRTNPELWQSNIDWRNIPEIVQAAYQEHQRFVRSHVRPVPSSEMRRRSLLGVFARLRGRMIDYFIRQPVICDTQGKIHCCVFNDETFTQFSSEQEGIFVGKAYQGNQVLDFDPDVCEYALVLKTQMNNHLDFSYPRVQPAHGAARGGRGRAIRGRRVSNNQQTQEQLVNQHIQSIADTQIQDQRAEEDIPRVRQPHDDRKFIDDWLLLLKARNSYFICFRRTLSRFEIPLRDFVQQEADNPSFDWQRIIDLFLRQYLPMHNHPYRFTSKFAPPEQYLFGSIRQVVMQHGDRFEQAVWLYYIDQSSNHGAITKHLQNYACNMSMESALTGSRPHIPGRIAGRTATRTQPTRNR